VKDCLSAVGKERGWSRGGSRSDPRSGGEDANRGSHGVRFLVFVLLMIASGAGAHPVAAQRPPPDATYLTIRTDHFRVTFPEGLDEVARRAAAIAESAHAVLADGFFPAPPGVIDLLVTDHVDLSNGSARVVPANRITVWAHPPLDGFALSDFDDWLELVVTHEVAHIFHLDYAGVPGRILRSVFGRAPVRWPYFPGYTVPQLAIEGVAVELESRHTGGGRIDGAFFEAMVRSRVLDEGAEPLGRGLSLSPLWPGAQRPYVYGSLFLHDLGDRFGPEAVARFLRAASDQWIPYRLDAAAREAFGSPFGALWDDWMSRVEEDSGEFVRRVRERSDGLDQPEMLTMGARGAHFPAAGPPADGFPEPVVAYIRDDARSDARLVLRTGTEEETLARVNSVVSPPRWTPDGDLLVVDLEYDGRYRVYRDLYRVSPDGGVSRVTRGMRVVHADPRPTGEEIVATLAGDGTTSLVLLSPAGEVERVLVEPQPGVLWSHPAWDPEGGRIAVVRKVEGDGSSVIVLDEVGGVIHELDEGAGRHAAPTWAPDGTALIWGSDRGGAPNLFGLTLEPDGGVGEVRQVTDLAGAGVFPSVDRSGDWIYFSKLGGNGWDLARIPFRPGEWFAPGPGVAPAVAESEIPEAEQGRFETSAPQPYRAIPHLLPRYWLPIHVEGERELGRRILPEAWGITSSGTDLVERHSWSARFAVPLPDPGRRVEWAATYRWAGLGNPVVLVEGGQWSEARAAVLSGASPDLAADTLFPVVQERFVGVGAEMRRQRVRSVLSLEAGVRWIGRETSLFESDGSESERYSLLRPTTDLVELRGGLAASTIREYPLSISPEAGGRVAVSVRQRWDLAVPDSIAGVTGVDGAFLESVAVVQGYRGIRGRGSDSHVLGIRLAGGGATGPGAGSDHFRTGGLFGTFGVRGHPAGAVRGRRAWSARGEWRFPLAVVDRGAGAWPLYVDRLAGVLFLDAGGRLGESGRTTSGEGLVTTRSLGSAGVEFLVSHSLFWEGLQRVAVGGAFPIGSTRSPSIHVRMGWSF